MKVDNFVSNSVIDQLDDLRSQYSFSKPFRHVIVDNFFSKNKAWELFEQFPLFQNPERLLNEFGSPNPKRVFSDVREINETYRSLDDWIKSHNFLSLIEKITGIDDLLYDPDYIGAGTHENFSTAGLDPHYDFNVLPRSQLHRRLNCIIYLNSEWRSEWGGQINLHNDAWNLEDDDIKSFDPIFNRCIVFETNQRSWHSVTPVSIPESFGTRSRKSFTIYLYTRKRPESEIAPAHGTVYVQPPLSKSIKPNKLLTDSQYAEIRQNIQRRHSYLKVMYQKEYGLQRRLVGLEKELTKWKRSVGIQLDGPARLTKIISPLNPDRWVGSELLFTFRATASVTSLCVVGFRPKEWGKATLLLTVGAMSIQSEVEGDLELTVPLVCPDFDADVELALVVQAGLHSPEKDDRLLAFMLTQIRIR